MKARILLIAVFLSLSLAGAMSTVAATNVNGENVFTCASDGMKIVPLSVNQVRIECDSAQATVPPVDPAPGTTPYDSRSLLAQSDRSSAWITVSAFDTARSKFDVVAEDVSIWNQDATRWNDVNLSFGHPAGAYAGGVGVIFIANGYIEPFGVPEGGGVLYAKDGALMWLGSNGTKTQVAPP